MMATVQLTGSRRFDTQITVPTETQNTDVNTGISKQLSNESRKHGIIDNVKHKKGQVIKVYKQRVSCIT